MLSAIHPSMSAPLEELSPCQRFRLLRQCETGAGNERQRIQLVLAQHGDCVLDLSDAGCRVDLCNFDANGRALLHLRLSRQDGSIAMYPATLDLDNGFYYHGDPRQAHAPAGQAADLEAIARGNGLPPDFDRGRAVRWPGAEQLAAQASPAPEPVKPQVLVHAPRASDSPSQLESPPSLPAALERRSIVSADGRFRVDLFPSGRVGPNARGEMKPYFHALFTDIEHGKIIADTRESREEAWLTAPDGTRMQLSTPGDSQEWVAVDLHRGDCWRENFREPTSETEPLQKLRKLLAPHEEPNRAARIRRPKRPHACSCLGDDAAAAKDAM